MLVIFHRSNNFTKIFLIILLTKSYLISLHMSISHNILPNSQIYAFYHILVESITQLLQ